MSKPRTVYKSFRKINQIVPPEKEEKTSSLEKTFHETTNLTLKIKFEYFDAAMSEPKTCVPCEDFDMPLFQLTVS